MRHFSQGKPSSSWNEFGLYCFLDAKEQLSILTRMRENLEMLYTDLSEYFVFDPHKYSLEEFFGDIKMFKEQFKKAHNAIEEERETIARAQRARAAREKSIRVMTAIQMSRSLKVFFRINQRGTPRSTPWSLLPLRMPSPAWWTACWRLSRRAQPSPERATRNVTVGQLEVGGLCRARLTRLIPS